MYGHMLKYWKNECMIAMKLHIGVHKYAFHQAQNTNSLRDTAAISCTWSLKVNLSNFTPTILRLGLA